MSDNVVSLYPGEHEAGGDGPEGPMLEQRVTRLEDDVKEIRGDVRVIRDGISDIKERFARIEGGFTGINAKLDALPTMWTFVVALIGSVIAAVAVSVTLVL